jgi:small conductance mechanosensitive channel
MRRFRQGTLLAVAITGLFLLLWGLPEEAPAQDTIPAAVVMDTAVAEVDQDTAPRDPAQAVEDATTTVRNLYLEFQAAVPGILIALALLLAAALLVRGVRFVLRRLLGEWERADAVTALSGVGIWLLAIGVALSVVAGDARALVGSVGLLGLALSWALQAPIESFAGWLLNSFKGYYRVGDRIGVGEVFGDVYRIDVLTTMVWEAGGPNKPVQGAQPTGALITFPNSEVLRSNIINYTRDFPHVWDEVTVGVTFESDLPYCMEVLRRVAGQVLGPVMEGPAREYRKLLRRTKHLGLDVATEPQVYASNAESWTDLTVRYLTPARERRKWASDLNVAISVEILKPEHAGRLTVAYPQTRVELLRAASDD